jgi:hypothetical protein
MKENTHFCILTPEGAITPDTFLIADRQPMNIMEGCLLVVHERTGRQMTVHGSRLIPVNDPTIASYEQKHLLCPKCGKVDGVMLDKVACPHHGGANCGLLASKQ